MNNGPRVLQWAHQNRHTLSSIAEKLGYSRQRLSDALRQNDISPALSKALFQHLGLRVISTYKVILQAEGHRQGERGRPQSVGRRGRPPGAGRGPGRSKLDPHAEMITQLLARGVSQKEIAKCYGTTPSNLHNWLKKRGLK